MLKVYLNGASAEKIAELLEGTVILEDTTNDTVLLANADEELVEKNNLMRAE